jgi:toxin ParE1/3/4
MAKYDISKQAAEDLYAIWSYTVDTWSESQADKYYSILEDAMEEIGSAPFVVGKPYDEIIPGLRAYHVRKHMLFFTIQKNGRAFLSRVLHERMDFVRYF